MTCNFMQVAKTYTRLRVKNYELDATRNTNATRCNTLRVAGCNTQQHSSIECCVLHGVLHLFEG
jgi:hypothetical protein